MTTIIRRSARPSVFVVATGFLAAAALWCGPAVAAPFYSIDWHSPTSSLVSEGDILTSTGTGQTPPPVVVIPFGAGVLVGWVLARVAAQPRNTSRLDPPREGWRAVLFSDVATRL